MPLEFDRLPVGICVSVEDGVPFHLLALVTNGNGGVVGFLEQTHHRSLIVDGAHCETFDDVIAGRCCGNGDCNTVADG